MNYEHIQQRDGQWCVVDILGKKGRVRTRADAGLDQDGIDHWTAAAGIGVGLTKGDAITGDRLSAQGILRVAVRYGRVIAPHDLRRYAECRIMPNRGRDLRFGA